MPGWGTLTDGIRDLIIYLDSVLGNPGLAIIVLTVAIKLLLTPLTLPALRNSRKQAELAPLIKEIQKKHGKDRAAATQEQMALYRQYGFNPMAGCAPMLVQAPIWFALWQGLMKLKGSNSNLGGFLWLDDISDFDRVGGFLPVLAIFAALAQFVQTRMAMQPADQRASLDPQQQMMNRIMQYFPLLVIVFGWSVPAGAVLYWFVSSMYSAVLQFFVSGWGSLKDLLPFLPKREPKRYLPPPRPEGYGAGSGKAGFMQRFQERMLEEQQRKEQQQQDGKQGWNGTKPKSAPTSARDADEEPVGAAVSSPAPTEELDDSEVVYTSDAWRLPGATGSTGRGGGVMVSERQPAQPRNANAGVDAQPRPNNRRKKKKRAGSQGSNGSKANGRESLG